MVQRESHAVIGTTLNQRFILETELGRGGMGAVYRASDQVLGRSVAIKVLKEQGGEEVGKRIRLEAQILARLVHDNVVRIYDFGEAEGTYYLVMEEVVGSSYVKRWKALSLVERLQIIARVAEALDYAHHQGIIHRDVKPANVLLTGADQPKLSDFGLSMIAEQKVETASIRGTPHYMSPEQARGKPLDYRTDLYSLGIMLYESATGSVPFLGPSLTVISQQANARPPGPRLKNPALSPELEALILRMLAKDPNERPATGHAIAEEIRAEIARERLGRDTPTETVGSFVTGPGPSAGPNPSAPTVAVAIAPQNPSSAPSLTATSSSLYGLTPKGTTPLVGSMLDAILVDPVALTPDERFLCGHYLAYLLGGSRRQGIFLRRPLDPRNADRARLLLALTSITLADGSDEAFERAVELLEKRFDARPALSPVVVVKYLAGRDTPAKRKRLRQFRKRLQESSAYAQAHMTDAKGLLNPGLIPQTLDDLRLLAPAKTEVDDELVSRWNRVAEVWRNDPEFRYAILHYATLRADRDPASAYLWPEVVYPLIERARWQRQRRPNAEILLDNLSSNLPYLPDAGVRLDRAIRSAVPAPVVEQLDLTLGAFADDEEVEADLLDDAQAAETSADRVPDHIAAHISVSLHELATDIDKDRGLVRLTGPDPLRFLQGDLRNLWEEGVAAMRAPGTKKAGHRHVPVGPYRLAVIPSIRGRSAGQVAIQGMLNKQIEMLTPSLRLGGSAGKPIVAVWTYQDHSLAIAYIDFKGSERYILWDAPNLQQENFQTAADLNHRLFNLGLEAPDQLDRALSKRFRPRNPV
jgi:serine/threonine-protein kinase